MLPLSGTSPALFLGIPNRNDPVISIGSYSCNADKIAFEISMIGDNKTVYLHGSNSHSLNTFNNPINSGNDHIKPGHILPRAMLNERNIECQSGECTDSKFTGQYGDGSGHNTVFSYQYDSLKTNTSIIKEAAVYAEYNSTNFYPVIYIFSEISDLQSMGYNEYCTPENTGIAPENIKGILIPQEHIEGVSALLKNNGYTNIAISRLN